MLIRPTQLGYWAGFGPVYDTVFHQTSTQFSTLAAHHPGFFKYWEVKGWANSTISSYLASGLLLSAALNQEWHPDEDEPSPDTSGSLPDIPEYTAGTRYVYGKNQIYTNTIHMMSDWNTEVTVWDKLRDTLSGDDSYWALWCAQSDLNSDSALYNKCYNTLTGLIGESETQNVLLQSYLSSYILNENKIPLTFTALLNGCDVKLSVFGKNIQLSGIYYKTNKDDKWQPYTTNKVIPLNNGDSVQFLDLNTVNITKDINENYRQFVLTGRIAANGNVMSMQGWPVSGTTVPPSSCGERCFQRLFDSCSSLITAPKLPATELAKNCYYNMFFNCTSLIQAPPELPATTLAENCYYEMFENCRSLIQAPSAIVATELAEDCCKYMFRNCTSLIQAPELPATGLAIGCYSHMFDGCSSLIQAPELPATTLASNCYEYMFDCCSSLTTVPSSLPATELAGNCYSHMFDDCISLTGAPELPATTLSAGCYSNMFKGCISLTTAPSELPAITLADGCYSRMFAYCSSLIKAPSAFAATELAENCCYAMFAWCTSLTTAPAKLPATTLTNKCYSNMFYDCISLTGAPELPATTLASNCYEYMFNDCISLTGAPELPATELAIGCYSHMFDGCTSLTGAPELPATTLSAGCYSHMFYNCYNLKLIKVNFTAWLGYSTEDWLYSISPIVHTGTFIKPSALSEIRGASYIPNRWTVKNIEESIIEPETESANADLVEDEIEE